MISGSITRLPPLCPQRKGQAKSTRSIPPRSFASPWPRRSPHDGFTARWRFSIKPRRAPSSGKPGA